MANSPSTPSRPKYAALLLGIAGTAAGLNLTVMNIGAGPINTTPEAALPAALGEPEVHQVVVDVPVPVREIDAVASTAPIASPAKAPAPAPAPSPAATPAPTPTAPAPATVPTTPAAPPTTAAPATTAAAPTTAPSTARVPTTEYLAYGFDGIAQIVIAYHDGQRLEFWSTTPEDGWAYMVEKDEADKVVIEFRRVAGGEGEAKFELIREDGELTVKKERGDD